MAQLTLIYWVGGLWKLTSVWRRAWQFEYGRFPLVIFNIDNLFFIHWAIRLIKLDLAFKHFSYWVLENETFEKIFTKSAKREEGGDPETTRKNPLSQTRWIWGWTLKINVRLDNTYIDITDGKKHKKREGYCRGTLKTYSLFGYIVKNSPSQF